MDTAERRRAPRDGTAARVGAQRGAEAPDPGVPAAGRGRANGRDTRAAADGGETAGTRRAVHETAAAVGGGARAGEDGGAHEEPRHRPLWIEEPARRRRLPDPVRTAAVRAVLIIAVTLIQAMVAFLCAMAGSWLAFPMVISSVVSTVVATWGALDVWVTRQVWNQRNGVVSTPSSTARALRRERRRARRRARAAERTQTRIRRRGGAGQLSHS
ncbi:hypothetical protein [Streptomyces sp. NPDC052701]|uniref:hypothetical protein n=1 Tax=Streptomyces sp. NPDC052701 TaxID=3155533 RepID=UPI00341E8ACB